MIRPYRRTHMSARGLFPVGASLSEALPDDRVDLSLPLRARDDRRSARVAEDVGRGTVHVERAVDGEHRTDDDVHVRASQTDRLEDDEDHHESCRRNRGSADGGQQRRKDHDSLLHDRQVEAKNLGDEERAHTLISLIAESLKKSNH